MNRNHHIANQSAPKRTVSLTGLLLAVAALLLPSLVMAKDYKVEAVIIQNLQPTTAFEPYQYQEIEELSSEAETWKLEPSMLVEYAEAVNQAANYRVLKHFSWGQESLPTSEAAIFEISEANLFGHIKVYANQLLFVNLDLDYDGYRLVEKRRIKLNEVHYFDHPKFGVLMQVSRLEVEPEDQPEVEPKVDIGSVP